MNALAPLAPSTLRTAALALLVLAGLAGCATPTPAPPSRPGIPGTPGTGDGAPGTAPPMSRPAAPVSPLVSEQRWLEEWFRGTPVTIVLADINTLAVDVPLANSFEAGKSNPKPALVAVLDRVATSLQRQPALRLSIAAPADAAATNLSLASARAQRVRDHLVSRGIPAPRMTGVGSSRAGSAVQLRLLATPQAIGRLDDGSLPPPSAGVRPVVATPAAGAKR